MTRLALSLAALLVAATPSLAQNPFAAARTVNDRIISNWEVEQRVRLFAAFGFNPPQPAALALEELTQDRLKIQAAEELGVQVTEQGFQDAVQNYAQQRQLSVDDMRARLRGGGVSDEAFNDFLRTSILWRGVIEARFRSRAAPSDDDMETTLAMVATQPTESIFLREIALPFAEHGPQGARDLAERIIQQVRSGTSFANLARQFSRAQTAPQGGSVGWTPSANLPPQIAAEILPLSPGGVSGPIAVEAAIIVLQVADIRVEEGGSPDAFVSYVRFDLPPNDPDATSALLEQARSFESCMDAELASKTFGGQSGPIGPVPITGLDGETALAIASLDNGETSVKVPSNDAQMIIHLCSRSMDIDPETVESLRLQVFNQRMNSFAAGYLQELLADAVLEEG